MDKYLKKHFLEEEHSFKLVGSVQDIFKSPGQLVFMAALLVFTMINVNVVNGPVDGAPSPSGSVVLGEATSIEANDPENQLLMYKLSVQNLVVPYIEQRSTYMLNLEQGTFYMPERNDWLGVVKQTQNAVMELVVPSRLKDTHILLVAVLLEEGSIIESAKAYDLSDFDAVNKSWENILLRNPWLNERQAL